MFIAALHGIEREEPPPEPEGKVDFDGGAREPEPPPSDPVGDHKEVVAEMLRAKELEGW